MKRVFVWMAAAALLGGCAGKGKSTETVQTTVERVLTKTAAAEKATVMLTEEFTSEIDPYKENNISPAASGVHIDRILADVGSEVRQGQLLATLDPTQYNQLMVQLRTLEDDYNRMLPVYEAGGISAQQIQQTKAQLDVQREAAANLKKNIEILSPLTGIVTARNYEPGDLYTGVPILTVMQINPLKVMVNISEQYYPLVKQGMPVDVAVEIFPDRTFKGSVSRVYPALDPATRTFTVEVSVPNADKVLRPGMYARTTFNMGEKEGIMVPDIAVQKQMGSAERYLYVIKDGKAERRSVKLGRQVGDRIDILSGVAAGEEVAITSLTRLSEGVEVEVKNN